MLALAALVPLTCTQGYDDFVQRPSISTSSSGDAAGGSPVDGGGAGGISIGGGGTSVASGGSSQGGAGGQGQAGGGGQGGACDPAAPNGCDSATDLGTVSGDAGNDVKTQTGSGSEWLQLYITEDAGPGNPLSYTATLTSPGNTKYDLYVHDGDANGIMCNAAPIPGSGAPEVVTEAWDDSTFGGGNDGRWLSLEVRYVTGADCDAEWSLTVAGNVQ